MNARAAQRRAGSRAFTLLELIVVIMMLMIALGVAAFTIYEDQDPFEEPVAKLRQMSKFALHSAALQHRTQTIAFDKKGFGMVGTSGGQGSYYSVPEDMKIFIYRWGGKSWEKAEGHFWPFGEQGICEPVKIRFETKESSRELLFHPLTGAPVES
jgi:hypothetical protein